jgi:hypothetical protein
MADFSQVRAHMEVIGADGARIGTVDNVEGNRIKLTKADSGSHAGHHHYISGGLVATIEGDRVRLSANGDAAVLLEEEKGGEAITDRSLWNWNKIGIGAAAVGVAAAAGAAMLKARSGSEGGSETGSASSSQSGDDFQGRLETDENLRLISSKKVEGTPVVDKNGANIGHIQSFMVDKYTGRVAYAVMSFGGTMGLGASLFPLPWPLLDYDVENDGYGLDITKDQMKDAPRFEANNEPEFSPEYRRTLISFYRPS